MSKPSPSATRSCPECSRRVDALFTLESERDKPRCSRCIKKRRAEKREEAEAAETRGAALDAICRYVKVVRTLELVKQARRLLEGEGLELSKQAGALVLEGAIEQVKAGRTLRAYVQSTSTRSN